MPHEFVAAWSGYQVQSGPPYLLLGDEALTGHRWSGFAYTDQQAYKEAQAAGTYRETAFHLGLLPQPFHGPIEDAEVYLLALNPGFRPQDYAEEQPGTPFRTSLTQNYGGKGPMIFLDPTHASHPGYVWWTRDAGLGQIAAALVNEFDGQFAAAQEFVARHVAVVQIAPYHSGRFARRSTLDHLRSVRLARAFVAEHVLPSAAGDACGAVMMWGPWGITPAEPNVVVHGGISGHRLGPSTRGGALILHRLRALARRLRPSS